MERLKKVAAECNLPWGMRTRTYNSRRAQELGKWAESLNRGNEYHQAVFEAYFADGLNIAKVSVLKELAKSVGLDGQRAEEVLAQGSFHDAVDRDWDYSRSCGITAVPTFLTEGRVVVGAQPYEVLAGLITDAGALRKEPR